MVKFLLSNNIETTKDGAVNAELHCPRCRSPNLHHSSVTSFNRKEDEEFVTVTTMASSKIVSEEVANDESSNPSSRRDGLAIRFWCEGCGGQDDGDIIELTLAQHKGFTEILWRFTELK
jgi:hypothetical protein